MTVKCLNANEKLSIIQTYKAKLKTQQELADDFGVSRDTIYRVIKAAKSAAPVSKGPARDSKGRFIAKGDVTLVVGSPIPAPVKIEVKAPEPSFIWNANSKFISITQGRETWNADKDHPNFAAAFAFLSQSVGNLTLKNKNWFVRLVTPLTSNALLKSSLKVMFVLPMVLCIIRTSNCVQAWLTVSLIL